MKAYIGVFSGALVLLPTCSIAQTPLSDVFTQLRSSDSVVRSAANDRIGNVFIDELPTIEKDASIICAAMGDTNAYVRQQASAMLMTIAISAPSHSSVIQTCTPPLLSAGSDLENRVRRNALTALAFSSLGTPKEAQPVFATALKSSDLREQSLGAVGLLRISPSNDGLISGAILEAKDTATKQVLLSAVMQARVKSTTLFNTAETLLYDRTPEIQNAAIRALAVSATDRDAANIALQNLIAADSVSKEAKQEAKGAVTSLAASK